MPLRFSAYDARLNSAESFAMTVSGENQGRHERSRWGQPGDAAVRVHCLLTEMKGTAFEGAERKRHELRSLILFLGRNGTLETELWGKDAAFRGGAMPHFFTRSGEPGLPDTAWIEATRKITEAVCCTGCRHCHLLEAETVKHAIEVPA